MPHKVPRAEFEEKQYEMAACVELMDKVRLHRGSVFSSGQVLEKILGYDAAAAPAPDHAIWRILEMPRPRGVRLYPTIWAPGRRPRADRLPGSPISLISPVQAA